MHRNVNRRPSHAFRSGPGRPNLGSSELSKVRASRAGPPVRNRSIPLPAQHLAAMRFAQAGCTTNPASPVRTLALRHACCKKSTHVVSITQGARCPNHAVDAGCNAWPSATSGGLSGPIDNEIMHPLVCTTSGVDSCHCITTMLRKDIVPRVSRHRQPSGRPALPCTPFAKPPFPNFHCPRIKQQLQVIHCNSSDRRRSGLPVAVRLGKPLARNRVA